MKPRFLASLHIIAFVLASAHQATADDAVWNGTTDAAWATPTNWSSDPNPVPGTGNTATFNNAGNGITAIDLGAGVTISSIVFDTVNAAAYTIGSGGAGVQALTLNDSGSITANNGINANQIVNANLTFGTDGSAQSYAVTNSDTGNSITFAGAVSGGTGGIAGAKTLNINTTGGVAFNGVISNGGATSLGIVKTGSSALTLNTATHTFSGGLSIEAGTLNITGSSSANNSTVSLGAAGDTGGTVRIGVINSGTNPTSPITIVDQTSGTATTRILGTNASTSGQWSGAITMSDDLTVGAFNTNAANVYNFTLNSGASVDLGSNKLTLQSTSPGSVVAKGGISGNGGVEVNNTNTGIVILEADNSYTGATTITAGTLQIGNNGAVGSIASTSGISNSGVLDYKRTGSLNQGGPISGTGPVRLISSGTVTFDKANTYSGATSIGNGGKITVATGGSIAPVTGAALNVGFNSGSGTLQYNSAEASKFAAIVVGNGTSNSGTLNQTAGTITATSLTLNNGYSGTGKGTVALSGGTMTISGVTTLSNTTTANTVLSTFTISNSAIFNASNGLRLTGAPAAGRSAAGQFIHDDGTVTIGGTSGLRLVQGTSTNTATRLGQYDLNGGTLNVNTITNTSTSAADALGTFNFNGGTLKPTASSATFWDANAQTTANVKDGGAKFDTAGFDITISQPLLKFAGSTTDNLTKDGLGTLTLGGTNTYTGTTSVNAGTLALVGGSQASPITVGGTASLGFTLGSPSVSSSSITLVSGSKIKITGTPVSPTSYTLVTASAITGTPVLDTPIPGYALAVESGNVLKLNPVVASGYGSWAATPAFGLAAGDQDPTDDPDNDSMDNLLEFVLNGNPSVSDSSILPDLVVTATDFEFTFDRRDDSLSPETTQTFQWGSTLASWTGSITIPAASGTVGVATVTVTPGTPADTVKISIPKTEAAAGKLFGRLQVVKP